LFFRFFPKTITKTYKKHNFVRFFTVFTCLVSLLACSPVTTKPIKNWQLAVDGAYAGSLSNDGKWAVISSIHHGMSVWDLSVNNRVYNWSQQQDNSDNIVSHIKISPNNSHVLTANRANFGLWNLQSGESIGYWKIRESTIRDVAIASNGKYLLLGKTNGVVVHVNTKTGRRLEFLGHTEKINTVDVSINGRIAMSGGNDFIAYIWDASSGQVIFQFNHTSRVSKVALDPLGRYAFSADSMKSASIWDLKTGKLITTLQGTKRHEVFSTVKFSKDGNTMLTGAASSKVSLWDIRTGKRLNNWHVTPKEAKRPTGAVVYSLAFSDNSNILTLSSSGYAELWQLPAQQ
jgi:WD40 repeat protein